MAADRVSASVNGRVGRMPYNDQASFAVAVERLQFNPFVLPLNWNFRPIWQRSFFGPLKIWHDYNDAPQFFDGIKKAYADPDTIIQFHEVKTI